MNYITVFYLHVFSSHTNLQSVCLLSDICFLFWHHSHSINKILLFVITGSFALYFIGWKEKKEKPTRLLLFLSRSHQIYETKRKSSTDITLIGVFATISFWNYFTSDLYSNSNTYERAVEKEKSAKNVKIETTTLRNGIGRDFLNLV